MPPRPSRFELPIPMINRQWLPALLNYRTEPPLAWEAQHKLFGFPIPA
jgi:hypothetical protein